MCNFFSFVTEPEYHGGRRFYFDWKYREKHLKQNDADSHDHIIAKYKLRDSMCNRYEYNPLTKEFEIDSISDVDDSLQAKEWVSNLDFKKIVKPLVIKPIINPFELKKAKISEDVVAILKEWAPVGTEVGAWASVRDSVWASVGGSVWDSVWGSVWDSVWASVWGSVGCSVGCSVWASVKYSVRNSVVAYASSFFDIKYRHDFTSAIKLWEMGIVTSFDGTTWRLHSGKKADVIYKITQKELGEK